VAIPAIADQGLAENKAFNSAERTGLEIRLRGFYRLRTVLIGRLAIVVTNRFFPEP
jgi:hypothetical protein